MCVWLQYLPKEELYAPPLNLRILDKRSFGRLPLVGLHIIKSLRTFHVKPVMTEDEKAALTGSHLSPFLLVLLSVTVCVLLQLLYRPVLLPPPPHSLWLAHRRMSLPFPWRRKLKPLTYVDHTCEALVS